MNKTIKNNILSRIFNSVFILVLISVLNACGGGGGGTPAPTATISDVSVTEGNSGTTDLVFTVSLTAAAGGNATVNYATSDGTAVAGQDYTAASGTLTVPSGATSATITVTVNTDTNYEADETLSMTLSGPSNLALGTASAATGTITNDDNANPKGYFTGTATVNTSTTISDLIGLAYNQRLLLFSRTGVSNVLYDIDLGIITNTSYSGTANVYENGSNTQSITVTGTTNDAQITGTFSGGSGLASGSFDILFDISNNRGAAQVRIQTAPEPLWTGSVFGIDVANGNFSNNTGNSYTGSDTDGQRCGYTGNYGLPGSDINIYTLSHNIIDGTFGTCTYASTTPLHTGFASIIDTSTTDDTLVYAFANGNTALFAVMNR